MAGLVVTVGAGAGLATLIQRGDDTQQEEVSEVPEITTTIVAPGVVDTYLAGPGALIDVFREQSEALLDLRGIGDVEARYEVCAEVADDLDAQVDPSELLAVAAGIPDGPLSEYAVSERSARSAALVACGQRNSAATDDALRGVEALNELFNSRREELR